MSRNSHRRPLKALAARWAIAIFALAIPSQAAKARVLVVTGGHAYDTSAFNAMWNSFTEVEWTKRELASGHEVFEDVSQWNHDVLVFFNHQNPGTKLTDRHKQNFRTLVDKGVGMFVLHHAVAAYPHWPEFEAMAGTKYRSSAYYQDTLSTAKENVDIACAPAEPTHPLAAAAPAAFSVHDEMYFKMRFASDNRPLLTTNYPGGQGPLAWTRKYGNSRVFTTSLGHGPTIFAQPAFRTLLSKAVAWIKPCAVGEARPECAAPAPAPKRVLIFHKQKGFIHVDTDSCVKVLSAHLIARGLPVETTKDSLAFTPANLARFGVVVFYNTNYRDGALLNGSQEAAMEDFIHKGGGFVGIHSAIPLNGAKEEAIWPWYARLFGARFRVHPEFDKATMVIEDLTHPSTQGLPKRITLADEWYQLQTNPRDVAGLGILASLDAASYPGGKVTGDHPVSWQRHFEGGRSWVTLVGHDLAAFANPDYLSHVRGGILWAGGWEGATGLRVATKPGSRPGSQPGSQPETQREQRAAGTAPGSTWIYRGADGSRLEIRNAAGRFIQAVRSR